VNAPTPDELRAWPVTVDVPTAGRCFGLGREASYRAAHDGTLPGVVKIGRRFVVVTARLREALGVSPPDNGEVRPDRPPGGPPTETERSTEGTRSGPTAARCCAAYPARPVTRAMSNEPT
jgi:hypothetical protein